MKYHALARLSAMALGAALAVGVTAQTPPATERPESPPGTVMTDVAPLPAEERSSTGAIVLQNSPVRAQRDNAAGERTGISSVGRSANRVLTGGQAGADAAEPRDAANDTRRMGAGSLTK